MTAAVYQTPAPLAAYLRRATLGLPPERREEVWNELEEHVLCRAERLEWTGLSPEEALAQALRELGPPLRVSAGMNGVHNMPKMIAFGVAGMLALSAGLYALAGSRQEVNLTAQTVAPKQVCLPDTKPALPLERLPSLKFEQCYSDPSGSVNSIFLDKHGTETLLKTVGLPFKESGDFINYETPAAWNMNNQTNILDPKLNVKGHYFYDVAGVLPLAFEVGAGSLRLANAKAPAFYDGKRLRLAFGTPDSQFVNLIYTSVGELAAPYLYGFSLFRKSEIPDVQRVLGRPKTIQTEFEEGEWVGVFQLASSQQDSQYAEKHLRYTLRYDVGAVDSSGRVKLYLPKNAQFSQKVSQQSDSRWTLVRLTNTPLNNLKSGIFLPK